MFLVAFSVMTLVICYGQADGLTHPPTGIPTLPSDVKAANWRDVSFVTEDALTLSGWLFLPEIMPVNGTILYVHGHGGNRLQAIEKMPFLLEAGYAVLLFDLRNHGSSGGTMTTMGLREVLDVKAAYAFLLSQADLSEQPIVLYGLPMGGGTAIMAMPDLPAAMALIVETAYTSFLDVTNDAVRIRVGLPSFPFGDLIVGFTNLITSENLYQVRPIDAVAKIAPRPILFIHGTEDLIIPFQHIEALYEQAGEPKTLYRIPGGQHGNLFTIDTVGYQQQVLDFLARYVAQS
jgi:fermentation-respiration switch protein FrsA (DUF1100 family)